MVLLAKASAHHPIARLNVMNRRRLPPCHQQLQYLGLLKGVGGERGCGNAGPCVTARSNSGGARQTEARGPYGYHSTSKQLPHGAQTLKNRDVIQLQACWAPKRHLYIHQNRGGSSA